MENKYSYFRDPRALAEIRKHKWIESQKAKREIGFATAAVDWIKNYGEEWKRHHIKNFNDSSVFIERRRFRRFKLDCGIELIKNGSVFLAEAINISFSGLLCRTLDYLYLGSELIVNLPFRQSCKNSLVCKGVVARVFSVAPKKYELLVTFDDSSQRKVEGWEYFRDTVV